MQDRKKYPIGPFEYGNTYSLEETRENIRALERLPKQLKKLSKKLSGNELDLSYRKGGWTARQVIHHIVDSHMNAYVRMKLALTENTPTIKPYNEAAWAETEDGKHGTVKNSIKLLSALHARWTSFLHYLTEEDLEKGYFHPDSRRVFKLSEAIALYAWHGKHHLAHIRIVADGEGVRDTNNKQIKRDASTVQKIEKEADNTPTLPALSEPARRRGRPKSSAPAATTLPEQNTTTTTASQAATIEAESKPRTGRPRKNADALAKPTKPPRQPRAPKAPKPELSEAEKEARAAEIRARRIEIMAKARAKRLAKFPPKPPKPEPSEDDAPKRTRRSKEEIAAAHAEQAAIRAAKKAEKEAKNLPKRELTEAELDAIRQRRIDNINRAREARLGKLAAEGKLKPKIEVPELSDAEKEARAAEIQARRIENMARARAARAAKKSSE